MNLQNQQTNFSYEEVEQLIELKDGRTIYKTKSELYFMKEHSGNINEISKYLFNIFEITELIYKELEEAKVNHK